MKDVLDERAAQMARLAMMIRIGHDSATETAVTAAVTPEQRVERLMMALDELASVTADDAARERSAVGAAAWHLDRPRV